MPIMSTLGLLGAGAGASGGSGLLAGSILGASALSAGGSVAAANQQDEPEQPGTEFERTTQAFRDSVSDSYRRRYRNLMALAQAMYQIGQEKYRMGGR